MKVAFLSHTGADSGAEQATVATLAHWPDDAVRPLLLLARPGPIEDRARNRQVECVVVPLDAGVASVRRGERSVRRLLSGVLGLVRHSGEVRRELERRSVDVVVATSVKALVFALLAGRRTGATVVWSLHDRVHRGYFPWFAVLPLRYLAPRVVDGVVVNSRSTLATIRPGRTPALVSTPAVDLDPREFAPPGDEVRKVVMLGRLTPWKGQDLFLRAFARAFAGTTTEAYVVGGALFGEDAYADELRRLAEDLGVADRVHLTGHVEDPWDWLVDADVLAHCSRIPEPFGMVVLQGLWARCAVVATEPGGAAEGITAGHDGMLVPCDDEPAMAAALRRLRLDRDLRVRLAAAGRQTAAGYDPTESADSLASWLTSLRAQMRSAKVRS